MTELGEFAMFLAVGFTSLGLLFGPIGNAVVIGSGAQVIGPISVGEGARVGANAVVTRDVAAGATVIGIPAKPVPVDVSAAEPREFLPYGTPCNEIADPTLARLCELERELHALRDEVKSKRGAETAPARSKRA